MTAFSKGFRDSGGSCCLHKNKDSCPSEDGGGVGTGTPTSSRREYTGMQKSVSVQVDSVFGLHLGEGVYEIKRMETRSKSRLRSVILICLALAVSGIIGFGYFCNDQVITQNIYGFGIGENHSVS